LAITRSFPLTAGSNPQSAPREQTAAQALTVPFELYDNPAFLQVRVNGSELRIFCLIPEQVHHS
jgi:hypothetical protein